MITSGQQSKILFISTFPPSKCGIASLTQDLMNAINMEINPGKAYDEDRNERPAYWLIN